MDLTPLYLASAVIVFAGVCYGGMELVLRRMERSELEDRQRDTF